MRHIIIIPELLLKLILNLKNKRSYLLDLLGKNKKEWILKTKIGSIACRPNTVDRWIATENLILDEYRLSKLKNLTFDAIIDIGANIGASVIALSHYFPNAKITAIEPNPDSFQILKKNIELNALGNNVNPINSAVTDSNENSVFLYLNADAAANSTIFQDEQKIKVNNMNFTNLEKYFGKNTLLKMDIEGEEHNFFKDNYLNLLKSFKTILVEPHPVGTENAETIERFLKEHKIECKRRGHFIYIFQNASVNVN